MQITKESKTHVDKLLFLIPVAIVFLLCILVFTVPKQTKLAFGKVNPVMPELMN